MPLSTHTIIPATAFPSETFTPIVSPTQTSTPVPTLVSHEWSQSEPLVTFGSLGGDGACATTPIDFTLLSNGELYIVDWNNDLKAFEIKTTTLSRQNTCNLLNSIDQAGFFDYDPSTYVYEPHIIMGGAVTYISIKAWRSNSVGLYALYDFIDNLDFIKKAWGCGDCLDLGLPTVLPSIRKTYRLLSNYEPENLQVYQPNRIGVWVEVDKYTDKNNIPIWPLKSVKLSQIVFPEGHIGDDPNIVLTGANAKSVYELFNQSMNCGINIVEGDKVYWVRARPLLPNEYPSESSIPTVLSCTPSDGWVEIP